MQVPRAGCRAYLDLLHDVTGDDPEDGGEQVGADQPNEVHEYLPYKRTLTQDHHACSRKVTPFSVLRSGSYQRIPGARQGPERDRFGAATDEDWLVQNILCSKGKPALDVIRGRHTEDPP